MRFTNPILKTSIYVMSLLMIGCIKVYNAPETPPSTVVTIPSAPTDLKGVLTPPVQIDLIWIDASNNEDGFKIERKSGTDAFAVIATLGQNVVTYSDKGLTKGTSYTYRVYSYNTKGNSSNSNEIVVKTEDPEVGSLKIGLIAYYPFTGNANDSSGNTNNGVVNGATLTTDRFGNNSSAYLFNGTSSYIDIQNKFFNNGLNDYSISLWVNPTSNTPTSGPGQTILNTNPHRGLGLGYSYSGSKKLYFFNAPDYDWDIADDKFNYNVILNNWINIIIIKRGVTFTYYVNGNIDKTTSLNRNPNSTLVSMRIGAITCCTPEYFNGKIDDVRFYNRILNDTEIKYLSNH